MNHLRFFIILNFFIFMSFLNAQTSLRINEILANNLSSNTDGYGDYDDWIEIYNSGPTDINISGYHISDNFNDLTKWTLSNGPDSVMTVPAGGFLLIWADKEPSQGPLHVGFKLSSSGEEVVLVGKDGTTILDSLSFGQQYADISYGRYPDGSGERRFFEKPSPESANPQGASGVMAKPIVSLNSAILNGSQIVELSVDDPAAIIRYTLDGSDPQTSSTQYSGPLTISTSTVLRTSAFKTDYIPSPPVTRVYFIDETFSLPVLSLITDPDNLWDSETGIYKNYKKTGRAWEREVQDVYFKNQNLQFDLQSGIRIQGSSSRSRSKKSFRLFFRKGYGADRLEYDLFNLPKVRSFKNIVLRSGYDDDIQMSSGTLLRDPVCSEIYNKMGQLTSAGNFATLYLNNDYWGVYNLRESINEYFIQDHTGYEDLDLIRFDKRGPELKFGTWDAWNDFWNFVETSDFTQDDAYAEARNRIDIDELLALQAFVQCVQYRSWGWGVSTYKKKSPQGKWRYTIWDMDRALSNVSWNGFTNYNDTYGSGGELWANLLMKKLLMNPDFKNRFINRVSDYLNSYCLSDKVIFIIDSLAAIIEPEMPNEVERWNSSLSRWQNNVQSLRNFASQRPQVVRDQMHSVYNLSDTHNINLDDHSGKGYIRVNSITIKSYPWTGIYYEDIPIKLIALPKHGYRFKQWQSGSQVFTQNPLTLNLTKDFAIEAVYEVDSSLQVVINEINYNSKQELDSEDWVELYNQKPLSVDLSGWILKDDNDDHFFEFPQNTVIKADSFLVICKDSNLFKSVFPNVQNYLGDFGSGDGGFGLSGKGDMVRLFDSQMQLVDAVTYDDAAPWPVSPDGQGYTLELTDPASDNSLAKNWRASKNIGGTPGKENSVFTAIEKYNSRPLSFRLNQNYPNPFNPTTIIRYQLLKNSRVELNVYNLLGQKIRTLIQKQQSAGMHQVSFDASGLAGGIYFYSIKADGLTAIKKMVYLK